MPIYQQSVRFERHFEIEASDAEEANAKLDELIRQTEFHGDVQTEGFYEFEDEDVQCPECKGCGFAYESEEDQRGKDCPKCQGNGVIPFKAS